MNWTASAPGRLDVMGGIADYSGSLVLQMPIKEETTCVIERRDDEMIVVESAGRGRAVGVKLKRLLAGGDLHDYPSAERFFRLPLEDHWASYVFGVVVVLAREEDVVPPSGFQVTVSSSVPEGKGVSSSAALEVAAMRALLKWLERDLEPTRMAALCQLAENRVAGAPCGIMDQMTAACGQRGKLMRLLCQPAELQGFIDLPDGVSVWGIDSGIRHAVTGSDYSSVRTAAFMGLRIIESHAGELAGRFRGYLANVGVDVFETRFAKLLPERMTGSEFLGRYERISDEVVSVDFEKEYRVRACTAHPVYEHPRIQKFASLLEGARSDKALIRAGRLMFESHEGYSQCGLGSPGTDRLVDLVAEVGAERGLFGARITGGGSGGTVAVLGLTEAHPHVQQIASRYEEETGRYPHLF